MPAHDVDGFAGGAFLKMDPGLLHSGEFKVTFFANYRELKSSGVLAHERLRPLFARQRYSVSSLHLDKTRNLTIEFVLLAGLSTSLSSDYRKPSWCNSLWWSSTIISISEPSSTIVIQLHNDYTTTKWLYDEMKRFPMYIELQFRIAYSLGAVLSRIRYPLSWK